MKLMFVTLVAAMLLLAPMALAAEYAVPDAPNTVLGTASVEEGAGSDPVIYYTWYLPDDSGNVTPETDWAIVPSGERDDTYACVVVGDVDSRDQIEDVYIDVFHPDGSFKYQMHGTWLNPTTNNGRNQIEACKDDALLHGLINAQDHADINYNIFDQPNWYMYKVPLPMYYHQPCGLYDGLAYAVDATSRQSDPYSRFFDWVCGTYLELDFTSVDFGSISPGFWKVYNGDTDMLTPDMPTLKNEGNTEVQVGVEFSEFIGTGAPPNKIIDDFDAQLRNLGTSNYLGIEGEHLEFVADEQVWFEHPISLCRQEKIDFSIHADVGTTPDAYEGSITIYAQAAPTLVGPLDEEGNPLTFPWEPEEQT